MNPEIQAIFSNFHHIFSNFDNSIWSTEHPFNLIWSTKFAYISVILFELISTGQISGILIYQF